MTQLTTIRPIVNTINRFTRALENPQDTAGLKKAFKRVQALENRFADAFIKKNPDKSKKDALYYARGFIRNLAEKMTDFKFKVEQGQPHVRDIAKEIRKTMG